MAQDNRLVQEFQNNTFVSDIGVVGSVPGGSVTTSSGLYGGGVMPYRQAPDGSLPSPLAAISGLATPGETDRVNKQPINRVCLFENEVHNIGQGQWHKYNESTETWDLVINLDNYHADTEYQHIGLYPIFNQSENKRYLITTYQTSISDRWSPIAYNKSDNVVTSGELSTFGYNGTSQLSPSEAQLGNNIYFTGSNTDAVVMVLNGTNLSIGHSQVGTVAKPADLCAYSGDMYMVHKDNSLGSVVGGSGVVTISRLNPVLSTVLRLPFEDLPASFPTTPERGYAVADVASSVARQKCVMFVDNNPATMTGDTPSMWVFYQNTPQKTPVGVSETTFSGQGTYGWSAWEIKADGIGGLYVVQQKDVLMGEYRAGLAESEIPVGNADQGVLSYCDNYPGWFVTSPEKGLLTLRPFGGEPGQTFKQWDFDPASGGPTLGPASIGGPTKVSFVQDKMGGGSRWSPAAPSIGTGNDVNIFDIVYSSGHFVNATPPGAGAPYTAWRIHYNLLPSNAYVDGTVGTVRWYYDKYHAPNKRITMINESTSVSHGTISNNQLTNVAISGADSYYLDWDFQVDGMQPSDGVNLCGLVFIAGADIPTFGL